MKFKTGDMVRTTRSSLLHADPNCYNVLPGNHNDPRVYPDELCLVLKHHEVRGSYKLLTPSGRSGWIIGYYVEGVG